MLRRLGYGFWAGRNDGGAALRSIAYGPEGSRFDRAWVCDQRASAVAGADRRAEVIAGFTADPSGAIRHAIPAGREGVK